MMFFLVAIFVYYLFIFSLNYFVRRKVKALIDAQQFLARKQRFLIYWSYIIGCLNIFTLLIRIFLTIWTRYRLDPVNDTATVLVEIMMIIITFSDWLTPASLLYLYKNISLVGQRPGSERERKKEHNPMYMDTLGTEAINKLLLTKSPRGASRINILFSNSHDTSYFGNGKEPDDKSDLASLNPDTNEDKKNHTTK